MAGERPIIDVDANGVDADGLDYAYRASKQAVADGFVTERAVRLRYPDGTIKNAFEVMLTPLGVATMGRLTSAGSA